MVLHLDIKKLGRSERAGHRRTGERAIRSRGAGWEYVFVAIDDHSRVAVSQILPDEGRDRAVAYLQAAHAHFKALGVSVQRVMCSS
jgi:hypothetical protein